MTRFILSICAGLVLNIILGSAVDHIMHMTEVYPPYGEPMLDHSRSFLAFAYRSIFMIIGGYLTASIAKDKSKKAVLVLGILGSVIWLLGGIAMWDYAYPWYNLIGFFLGIPITMMGYVLYQKRLKRTLHANS